MIPWHPLVKIVEQQADILLIHKPCGLLSHPNKSGTCKQSLLQAPYDFSQQGYRTQEGLIYLLNRLDSPTSGLIVLCKKDTTAKYIRKLFKEHKVKKTYQAIVKGRFIGANICWQDKLLINKSDQHLRTYRTSHKEGMLAKTIVNPIQNFKVHGETFSLIQLSPITGRTHQLRVQCAQHHHPILGDKIYGDFKCNHKLQARRLYLHACSIEFSISSQNIVGYCESNFSEYIQKISSNSFHL